MAECKHQNRKYIYQNGEPVRFICMYCGYSAAFSLEEEVWDQIKLLGSASESGTTGTDIPHGGPASDVASVAGPQNQAVGETLSKPEMRCLHIRKLRAIDGSGKWVCQDCDFLGKDIQAFTDEPLMLTRRGHTLQPWQVAAVRQFCLEKGIDIESFMRFIKEVF